MVSAEMIPLTNRRLTMNILTKSVLGAGAAAAALVSVAAPAQARGYERDSINAGDIIAGAIVIGGLAAVLSDSRDNRDRRYEGDYRDGDNSDYNRGGYDNRGYDNGYNNGYNNQGNGRAAINQCVAAAEAWGNRYSRVKVTEIRDIDRTRYGYKITGNLVLKDGWRGNGGGYGQGYGRGHDEYRRGNRDNDYGRGGYNRYDDNRGYGNSRGYGQGYDKGRFACYVENGRVVDVKYSGLDDWR
jgi:hypothetical protein